MADREEELEITADGREAIRIIAVDGDHALATFAGRLGVHITRITPDMPLWPHGMPSVTLRFTLTANDGTVLLESQEITLENGHTATLGINHKEREVGVEWLQELTLTASNDAAAVLLNRALLNQKLLPQ